MPSASFDGLQFAVNVYLDGTQPDIELVFLNLTLPLPGFVPGTYSLQQLHTLQESASVWIAAGMSVLAGQIAAAYPSNASAIDAVASDVLDLIGIGANLPSIDWASLVSGDSPQQVFLDWFTALIQTPNALQSWLNALCCLLNPTASQQAITTNVPGKGTLALPYSIALYNVLPASPGGFGLSIELTAASDTDANGVLSFYPGLSVSTTPLTIGSTPIAAVSAITAEFAAIPLNSTSPPSLADILFPSLEATIVLQNTDATQPLVSVNSGTMTALQIGTFEAGIGYYGGPGAPSITPTFEITNVVAAGGAWDVINLDNWNADVQLTETAITSFVQGAINSYFPSDEGVAAAVMALAGLSASSGAGSNWPSTPLSLSNISQFVSNPLATLGAYYTALLTSFDDEGAPLLVQLLPQFSSLFGVKPPATLPGSGTQIDPWLVPITAGDSLNLLLTAWADTASPQALHLGVQVSYGFAAIDSIQLEAAVSLDLVELHLPALDGTGALGAVFFPSAEARLNVLPSTGSNFSSESVGGVSVQVDSLSAAGGWSRTGGLYASAIAYNPQLISSSDGQFPISNTANNTLEFIFAPGALSGNLQALATPLVYFAGLQLLQNGGRFGVAVATLLGLTPNVGSFYTGANQNCALPSLPADWPTFTVGNDFFSNPWSSLNTQFAQLLGSAEFAEAAMQIVGFAVTGTTPTAPATLPAGTQADPFWVALPDVLNLQVLLFTDGTSSSGPGWLNFGLQRLMSTQGTQVGSNVSFNLNARVDVAQLALPGATGTPSTVPLFTLTAEVSNPTEQPLVPASSTTGNLPIYSATLGGSLDGSGVFTPIISFVQSAPGVITLTAAGTASGGQTTYTGTITGGGSNAFAGQVFAVTGFSNSGNNGMFLAAASTATTLVLDNSTGVSETHAGTATVVTTLTLPFSSGTNPGETQQMIAGLLGAVMTAIAPQATQGSTLEAVFEVLADLGLTVPPALGQSSYTLSDAGFNAFTADPITFLGTNLDQVLQDPTSQPIFFQQLATALGLSTLALPAPLGALAIVLDALGLTVNGGPVVIGGGLLDDGGDYAGMLTAKVPGFGFIAEGAYEKLPDGSTSLFVYAAVSGEIGGIPAFFVTGLAAGFGINRNLVLPAAADVTTFPLVSWAVTPTSAPSNMSQAIQQLCEYIPPVEGQYWMAAGIQFLTYDTLSTFLLLAVTLGNEFSVALLGASTLSVPAGAPPEELLVNATLGIAATCIPDRGELAVGATLTSNSWVLTPDLKLTGGFAFGYWWSPSPYAGDFVVTLGGYHPQFVVPSYYPNPPRLGINWQIDGNTRVTGGSYFALCPSAAMVGISM